MNPLASANDKSLAAELLSWDIWLRVNYIDFDSLGVKSSCVEVETGDYRIVIDPGIAEEVDSFPLPAVERSRLASRYASLIREAVRRADIVILTHYHYDHHLPRDYRYRELIHETYRYAEKNKINLKTVAELLGTKPFVIQGLKENGPTKWRKWKRFEKKDIYQVLKNAARLKLINRRWIRLAEDLSED